MVLYKCIICGFKTIYTTNYNKHLQTKKHKRNQEDQETLGRFKIPPKNSGFPPKNSGFPPKNSGLPPKSTNLRCEFCNTLFSRKDNLHRHTKSRCPVKKSEIKQLEHTIEKLESSQSQTITNNTTHNNTTNQYIIFNNNKYYMEDIYKMGPKMLTNTFFKANPSLHELTQYFVKNLKLEDIEQYRSACDMHFQSSKDKYIAIAFDSIIKKKLQEMMKEKKESSMFCDNYILSNDGSHRRFLTKGVDRWDYWTLDIPTIDKMFWAVIDLHNKNYKPEFFSVPRRQKIIKFVKNQNDWECNKSDIIGKLNVDEGALTESNLLTDMKKEEPTVQEPKFDQKATYQIISDGDIQYRYNVDTDEVFSTYEKKYIGMRVYNPETEDYFVDYS